MQESKTGINKKCCNDAGLKARGVEKAIRGESMLMLYG